MELGIWSFTGYWKLAIGNYVYMQKHCTISVFGNVQGVGFRYYTAEKARKLGILGFVHNEPDGTVYIEAEGEEEALKELIRWCGDGSTYAQVSRVDVEWSDVVREYKDFIINRS